MQEERDRLTPESIQGYLQAAITDLDFARTNANSQESARSLALVITKLEEAKLWLQQFRVQSGELTIHYTSNVNNPDDTANGQQDTEAAG